MDMFVIILVFLLTFFDPAMANESELTLPNSRAKAEVQSGARVRVSRSALLVEDKRVAGIDQGGLAASVPRDGRKIVPLFDALASARQAGDRPLIVECDKSVPYSLVGDVLFTAGAAGWTQFRFVVVSDSQ